MYLELAWEDETTGVLYDEPGELVEGAPQPLSKNVKGLFWT